MADGIVYAPIDWQIDQRLVAFDGNTGKQIWKWTGGIVCGIAVADAVLFMRQGDTLYALHARTGRERWRFVVGGSCGPSDLAVTGGTVYVEGDGRYLLAIGGSGSSDDGG